MANTFRYPTVVVISDLHIGDGSPGLDDFTLDGPFEDLLDKVIPAAARGAATLVINGDFLDFVRVLPELGGQTPGDAFGTTEAESCAKLKRILNAHPRVFDALGRYLVGGGQVLLLAGNHDVDLYWPKVQEDLFTRVGRLAFVAEGEIADRGVFIEHGHQAAAENRFATWPRPFLQAPDGLRLERAWGTLFLDLVYNDLQKSQPLVNRISPHGRAGIVELRSLLQRERVPLRFLARLAVFFARKGKAVLLRNLLLGEEDPSRVGTPSAAEIEAFLGYVAPALPADDRKAVVVEAEALGATAGGGATESQLLGDADSDSAVGYGSSQLLGETEEGGLSRRGVELLRRGFKAVVFGHTHVPIDGRRGPPPTAPGEGWLFNTGSWLPRLPLGKYEVPSLAALGERQPAHDVRYLLLRLGDTPHSLEAALESLTIE